MGNITLSLTRRELKIIHAIRSRFIDFPKWFLHNQMGLVNFVKVLGISFMEKRGQSFPSDY